MVNQIIGNRCGKSGECKRIEWDEGDSNKNVIALHTGVTRSTGYSNDALSSVTTCMVENSDGSLPASLRALQSSNQCNQKTSPRRQFLNALKKFIRNKGQKISAATLLPISWTSSIRMQCRRRRQQQKRKNGCSLMLYPYFFFTSLSASNTSKQSIQKKEKEEDYKQEPRKMESQKQFYPKNSMQSTAAAAQEGQCQPQQLQHKTSNNIYNRQTSNNSNCMNMRNYNHNTNNINGLHNNSSKNIKKTISSTAIDPNTFTSWPSASTSIVTCSTISRRERKSISYVNNIHTGIIATSMQDQEQRQCRTDKTQRSVAIDYVHLLKKMMHYLFIVNCLVYVVDGNLSMTQIGAFGAITSNYSIVPSATITPILMSTMSINRTAIGSDAKNSIRTDGDGTDEDVPHSLPLAELNAMRHQPQPHQLHYNHHRHHKNAGNAPAQSHNKNDESVGNEASSEQYAISPSASSHHFQKMARQHQAPHSAHHTSGTHLSHGTKHSALKHHQFASAAPIDSFDQTTIPTGDSSSSSSGNGGSEEYVGCTSCQFREQLKAQNLASIKMHILARLAMSQPPNITTRPPISEHLIQSFYSQNGFRYIRVKNNYHTDDSDQDINEMLGDDPATYHDESMSTLAEHNHDTESIPFHTEHHAQHHHHDVQQHHHNRHPNNNNVKKADDIENVSHKYYNSDTEYNDEFDSFDGRGGIVYNPDYYDEVPPEFDEDADEAFYSITDSIYSYPKRKC